MSDENFKGTLPQRPSAPAFMRTLIDKSAAIAATTAATTVAAPIVLKEESRMSDQIVNPFAAPAEVPTTAPFTVNPESPVAAVVPTVDDEDEVDEADALPRNAGIVDYRPEFGAEALPEVMTDSAAAAVAEATQGMVLKGISLPVIVETLATKKDGTPILKKDGKQSIRKTKVPTNVSVLLTGEDGLGWLLNDDEYSAKLVAEMLLHKVQQQLKLQGIQLKEGWVLTTEWLKAHFGAESIQDALDATLRPWAVAATRMTSAAAAAIQEMCSTVDDVYEIIQMYEFTEERLTAYIKHGNSKVSVADINAQLGPIHKSANKWRAYAKRLEAAELAGKATPKKPVIKALAGESPKSILAVSTALQKLVELRDASHTNLVEGRIPKRFTPEDVQEYLAATGEHNANLLAVSCWLNGIAQQIKLKEARNLKKYAAVITDADAEEDVFM